MLDATLSLMADLIHHVSNLQQPTGPPSAPNPENGQAPPFANELTTLLKWALWMALAACVLGFIIIGARMGLNHSRGEAGGHLGSLGIVGFACIVIMGAYTFVTKAAGL